MPTPATTSFSRSCPAVSAPEAGALCRYRRRLVAKLVILGDQAPTPRISPRSRRRASEGRIHPVPFKARQARPSRGHPLTRNPDRSRLGRFPGHHRRFAATQAGGKYSPAAGASATRGPAHLAGCFRPWRSFSARPRNARRRGLVPCGSVTVRILLRRRAPGNGHLRPQPRDRSSTSRSRSHGSPSNRSWIRLAVPLQMASSTPVRPSRATGQGYVAFGYLMECARRGTPAIIPASPASRGPAPWTPQAGGDPRAEAAISGTENAAGAALTDPPPRPSSRLPRVTSDKGVDDHRESAGHLHKPHAW